MTKCFPNRPLRNRNANFFLNETQAFKTSRYFTLIRSVSFLRLYKINYEYLKGKRDQKIFFLCVSHRYFKANNIIDLDEGWRHC